MKQSIKRFALVLAATAMLAACSGAYTRGIFQGYVVGATEEEITSKVGKPDAVDGKDPSALRWTYNKKTFDPDNMNRTDEKTVIVLRKDAAGKFVGAEVQFL
jgi:hypothetical protein